MELQAKTRDKFGKQLKKIRKDGLIPAELYGHNVFNRHLVVNAHDFLKIFKEVGSNKFFNLVIDSKETVPVLIHNVQKDYLTNEVIHVDFYQIKMDEKIKARIPLEFTRESPAVKNLGGVLNKSMHEIEVEALPQNLPPTIKVYLSELKELNQTLYVKDLKIPEGVKVLVDENTPVATVTIYKEEVPVAEVVDVGAVKVESEEKKIEREKKLETENK